MMHRHLTKFAGELNAETTGYCLFADFTERVYFLVSVFPLVSRMHLETLVRPYDFFVTRSFVCLFACLFICSFARFSFARFFIRQFARFSFAHLLTSCSLIRSFACFPSAYSLVCSFGFSFVRSFVFSLCGCFVSPGSVLHYVLKSCCYGGQPFYAKMYEETSYNVIDLPHCAQVRNGLATFNVSCHLFFAVFQQFIFHQ